MQKTVKSRNHGLVLFNPLIEPLSGATTVAKVDLGSMAMKWYSAFPKHQHYWNLTIRLFSVKFRTLVVVGCLTPM